MPVGTAEKHLRKSIVHELASQLGKNVCCRCGLKIESPDDLAIVHVQDWEGDPSQFWALTNVAFSHASCEAARHGKRQREKKQMSKVEVRVQDPHGKPLLGAKHEGEIYVAGNKGREYQIRVRNKTNERVLVVVTVDGRNVITGEPGDHHGTGHVLEPRATWTFKGWRTSDDEVAAFEFGKKSSSYSSQMGTPENVGVIGVAVFEEEHKPPNVITVKETVHVPWYPTRQHPWPPPTPWYPPPRIWFGGGSWSSGGGTFGSSGGGHFSGEVFGGTGTFGSTADTYSSVELSCSTDTGSSDVQLPARQTVTQQLGTGWGATLTSKVHSTKFDRATDAPCEVHVVRYDSRKALERRGILVKPSQRRQEAPQPFPENRGYCPPPPRQKLRR